MGLVPISNTVPGANPSSRAVTRTAPAAASATAVHAAVTLGAGTTTVTTGFTQPDVPRNLTIKGNASGIAGNVVLNGLAEDGSSISETVALSGSTEVVGNKAFASIASAVFPAKTNSSGDTVSIGWGSKLGVGTKLSRDTVINAYLGGVREATRPTVAFSASAVESNTAVLSSALNGTDVILDFYST